jgi:hypothetical protein
LHVKRDVSALPAASQERETKYREGVVVGWEDVFGSLLEIQV